MSNGNELIECEYREGITLSDREFYERCEIENEEGEITVLGFFTEEGKEMFRALLESDGLRRLESNPAVRKHFGMDK